MALGILAALFEKQRTGRGQRVDASLFETGVMLMCYHLLYQQFTGVSPGPEGSRHNAMAPYGAFATLDGAIMIGISNDRLFRRLCTAIGREDWLADPRFSTNASRVRNRADLEGPIADLVCKKPTENWLALFKQHDVPGDAVQNAEQVMDDKQAAALDQLAEVVLDGEGSAKIPRLPIGLSLTPPVVAGPPPKLGEHGRAILLEAGYSEAEIDELVRSRACAIGS
jgi:crotonobetainyl-CoA:carnitine CoA-transferase CaiB-like acyl-CoA transferase